MVTIKNTSKKIINIGTTPLLPDETMEVTPEIIGAPAIMAMVGRKQLAIVGGTTAEKPAEDTGKDAGGTDEEGAATGSGETEGETGDGKKPLSRMNKAELVEECRRLGIEAGPDDTNQTLVEKIKAASAQ